MKKLFVAKVAFISIAFICSAANAQFKLPSLPGASSSSNAPAGNPSDVVKNARNSLTSFVKAKLGLIEAMGGSDELAAQQKLLDGLKKGDAAATKEDLETIVSLDKATGEMIAKKTGENAKLDAKNKATASKSMVEYVGGLVSAKKLISSVTSLSKNPMSLGSNLGAVTYLVKELPTVISSGSSTTSTLFTYLNSNGVDTSEAKKAASDLGV